MNLMCLLQVDKLDIKYKFDVRIDTNVKQCRGMFVYLFCTYGYIFQFRHLASLLYPFLLNNIIFNSEKNTKI